MPLMFSYLNCGRCESKGADHVWFGGYGNPSRVDEKIHRVSFKDALPDDREVIRNLQEERRRDAWPLRYVSTLLVLPSIRLRLMREFSQYGSAYMDCR